MDHLAFPSWWEYHDTSIPQLTRCGISIILLLLQCLMSIYTYTNIMHDHMLQKNLYKLLSLRDREIPGQIFCSVSKPRGFPSQQGPSPPPLHSLKYSHNSLQYSFQCSPSPSISAIFLQIYSINMSGCPSLSSVMCICVLICAYVFVYW